VDAYLTLPKLEGSSWREAAEPAPAAMEVSVKH
jgi:hypothetical protein